VPVEEAPGIRPLPASLQCAFWALVHTRLARAFGEVPFFGGGVSIERVQKDGESHVARDAMTGKPRCYNPDRTCLNQSQGSTGLSGAG